jgi:hypothetical protein
MGKVAIFLLLPYYTTKVGGLMENVCIEKHKRIDERMDVQDKRLDNHSNRLDKLEQFESSTRIEIRNLIEQIKNLVNTLRWFTGITITTLIGFFIWYIQNLR